MKNNIVGTLNVVRLAAERQVRRFVLVSTDKAVNPTSVMGSTKRVAEKIVKGFAETHDLNMVSVRFGNVLGSRGSVVPTMSRQIRTGQAVTVTDPEMVRYFMTIPEAVHLILQAGATGGRWPTYSCWTWGTPCASSIWPPISSGCMAWCRTRMCRSTSWGGVRGRS